MNNLIAIMVEVIYHKLKGIGFLILMSLILFQGCKMKSTSQIVTDEMMTKEQKDIVETQKVNYNKIIKLKNKHFLEFEDGLKIELTHFGHKSSVDGKTTQASAKLEITKNKSEENPHTSVNRYEYEDKNIKTSYDSTDWEDYHIELIQLSYGESIDIIVSKK